MKNLAMVAIALVCSCAHFQPQFVADLKEEKAAQAYQQAEARYQAKEYASAAPEFKRIIDEYPGTKAHEPSLYLLAFCHYKLSDFEQTTYWTERFLAEFPYSNFATNILGLAGDAYIKSGDPAKGVQYLLKYHAQVPETSERDKAFSTIMRTLPQLGRSDLDRLHRAFMADPMDEHLLYYLIRAKISDGKQKEARTDYEVLKKRFPETRYTISFDEVIPPVATGETTGRAGILLPLSGKFAAYGTRLSKVLRLFEQRKSLPFTAYVMDTKSDPIDAILAAIKLVDERKVDFIVGPIFSIEAFGVCGLGSGRGVPVIIPTALEARFASIPLVYTAIQNEEMQARIIARYAVTQYDLRRIGVIHLKDTRYESLARVFSEEVIKYGGEIVGVESFSADSITLKWQLGRLKKADPDAIFLAMDTEGVINTAPQVMYYGIAEVRLLGIESFNHESVPRLGEKYVEGAIFVAPATIDSLAMGELARGGVEDFDFVTVRFYQVLDKLRYLSQYSRADLGTRLTQILKGDNIFHVYQIRNGEFAKITDVDGKE